MEMKKINIIGERQTGKSTLLIHSMFVHLIDKQLPTEFTMIASAPNVGMRRILFDGLIDRLKESGIKYTASVDFISVEGRMCKFLAPLPSEFIGRNFDYVFLDNVDYFDKRFLDFIDMIIRPNVIVVQTQEDKSTQNAVIPVK